MTPASNDSAQIRPSLETTQGSEIELFAPSDAAKKCECCPTTVKRLADEIHLPTIRTVGGMRLFTRQQVERIQQERQRRAAEALR